MQNGKINKNILMTYGMVLLGVLIGCSIFGIIINSQEIFFTNYSLEEYNIVFDLSDKDVLLYVFPRRFSQIILFILFTLLTTYYCATMVYCFGFGIYYGFTICDLIIKYGFYGFGYGFFCFLPHYLFVLLILYMVCKWKDGNYSNSKKYDKSMKKIEDFIKIIVIIILFSLAFVWEIKFQKIFLNYFFQYLV